MGVIDEELTKNLAICGAVILVATRWRGEARGSLRRGIAINVRVKQVPFWLVCFFFLFYFFLGGGGLVVCGRNMI